MTDQLKEIVYSRDTIEFVTVAVQYCAFLENFEETTESELTDKLTKLLPLLYLKASLVPETDTVNEEDPEISVTEDDYNYISSRLYNIYLNNDAYLEVFLQDMKYSETPIAASISEDLADIYQDLKNFATIFERGITENMNDALYVCIENFKEYWGQKLVNVLRALHSLKYTADAGLLDEDNSEPIDTDELW
ncbi:hypothetical protein M2451_002435 [Dysgonomonas sp. PFB1-18]|uniref:DUF5063 domain-containing protein n=1 Tax=unclassified Dysgonomonas TaxID=2630389 RepID=UPI002474C040|nr:MULTISPECIES: DUF5063 domain-containing protein [unclassified Dysgonomonas]MDH6307201.1 hypothetical protein [Dysgonomonas sp. PF1-14]MDH6337120.1 hypothetical protein [Dysgonomonas sp. PF1-16]MDH6381106.1 hypothetical protein [Dysgonomonas sp. PFB1-18]MDH6396315.1 hypothetical protein [Dysgonomonas sp. PF1-23]